MAAGAAVPGTFAAVGFRPCADSIPYFCGVCQLILNILCREGEAFAEDTPCWVGVFHRGRRRRTLRKNAASCPVHRAARGRTRGRRARSLKQCRSRRRRRGAGGDSPRQNKLKVSPFPGVGRALFERGSGGWGERINRRQVEPGRWGISPPSGTGNRPECRTCRGRGTKSPPPGRGEKNTVNQRTISTPAGASISTTVSPLSLRKAQTERTPFGVG